MRITLALSKTLKTIVGAQQKYRTCGLGQRFMRLHHLAHTNAVPKQVVEWFFAQPRPNRHWSRV
jgi:hypothetical protein